MHELSLANHLMQIASEQLRQMEGVRVVGIELHIGALACVHDRALRSCFALITQGTPLEQAELRITKIPLTIYCSKCAQVVPLPGISPLRCPRCDTPSNDIRQGRELDLVSLEIACAADSE